MTPELTNTRRSRLALAEYVDGILRGDRTTLARAVTVIESELASDIDLAAAILDAILPHSGAALRLGITGVPGAGKSTFIDRLGMHLIRERGENVAVLSLDPSSPVTGGSILGDKTRMQHLAAEEKAFIRPSPARGHLGGVGRATRETILLCEAAGYRNILVETVGVGQSETAVRSMTDFFLLILLGGAGDELQGIKRGIFEMVDAIAVNKADGENERNAKQARAEYARSLRLFPKNANGWLPVVLTTSSITGKGVVDLWNTVLEYHARMQTNGFLAQRRKQQALDWLNQLVTLGFQDILRTRPQVAAMLNHLESQVSAGKITPLAASRQILSIFKAGN